MTNNQNTSTMTEQDYKRVIEDLKAYYQRHIHIQHQAHVAEKLDLIKSSTKTIHWIMGCFFFYVAFTEAELSKSVQEFIFRLACMGSFVFAGYVIARIWR